jgi:hypothetical protein
VPQPLKHFALGGAAIPADGTVNESQPTAMHAKKALIVLRQSDDSLHMASTGESHSANPVPLWKRRNRQLPERVVPGIIRFCEISIIVKENIFFVAICRMTVIERN